MSVTDGSSIYYGKYLRFEAFDAESEAVVASADTAVGDMGTIEWDADEDGCEKVWLKNPRGVRFARLSPEDSQNLATYRDKGWRLRCVTGFTASTEGPDGKRYWGEAAVFAYDPTYEEEFDTVIKIFSNKAGEGFRPSPELNTKEVNYILLYPALHLFVRRAKMPELDENTVIIRDHRAPQDALISAVRFHKVVRASIKWVGIAVVAVLAVTGVLAILGSVGLF